MSYEVIDVDVVWVGSGMLREVDDYEGSLDRLGT